MQSSIIKLYLYNTQTRDKELFTPINEAAVRMYVCGPTIYDYIHLGNARPCIIFDILFRVLRAIYGDKNVFYVRNVTDVDDKITARARTEYADRPILEAIEILTQKTYDQFQNDVKLLGCLLPTKQPRARDHLADMHLLIEKLIETGHAYINEEHVLFSVASMDGAVPYGSLSKKKLEELVAGARVEVAPYKKGPMDFVLWKPSQPDEPSWDSPAGIQKRGRPGWHIECSAMSFSQLVVPFGGGLSVSDPLANMFDIHAGGLDLIFPHHENEIAQTCCALNTEKMANYWLHNGFLLVEDKKMSKSLGNFFTVREVLDRDLTVGPFKFLEKALHPQCLGLAVRLAFLQTHYRSPFNWSNKRLHDSLEELGQWYKILAEKGFSYEPTAFPAAELFSALCDDLNTPQYITGLRKAYKEKNVAVLGQGLVFLGLYDHNLFEKFLFSTKNKIPDDSRLSVVVIEEKLKQRLAFLEEKNWAKADEIREELKKLGIELRDEKDKTSGVRRTKWFYH